MPYYACEYRILNLFTLKRKKEYSHTWPLEIAWLLRVKTIVLGTALSGMLEGAK